MTHTHTDRSRSFSWPTSPVARPVLQLVGTLLILALVPTNAGKAVSLLVFWGLVFSPLRRDELLLFVGGSLFFAGMNVPALANGVFRFHEPDLLGMPVWELGMWGFYLLNAERALGRDAPHRVDPWAVVLALATGAAFATLRDFGTLTAVTACLLMLGIVRFHERKDLAYVAYMVFLGTALEYTGVASGLWSYPGEPWSGVPPWYVTLFGSVGLYLRRLVQPMLVSIGTKRGGPVSAALRARA